MPNKSRKETMPTSTDHSNAAAESQEASQELDTGVMQNVIEQHKQQVRVQSTWHNLPYCKPSS
jgi:hypothetical protein